MAITNSPLVYYCVFIPKPSVKQHNNKVLINFSMKQGFFKNDWRFSEESKLGEKFNLKKKIGEKFIFKHNRDFWDTQWLFSKIVSS